MKPFKIVFGIDVSLALLDIYEISGETYDQIPNTLKAIQKWIKQVTTSSRKEEILCVIESTGCYSSRLVHLLSEQGIAINLINPIQSNSYTKALGIISKDDRQAAKTLALMGLHLNLSLHKHPSEVMQKRKQLLMGINALKKQRQMLRNQLHALEHQILFAPEVVKALEQTLETIETELQKLEEELNELSDEEHQQQFDLITSVVGVGAKTAQLLLAATGGLQHFDRAKQLSKFTGLVPSSHYSGSSIRKKGRITKKGDNALRACLFMAARSAIRFNLACKDLYTRLRRIGKSYKQAMVAVMNKLIKQIFGVVNSKTPFDNEHYLKFQKIEK